MLENAFPLKLFVEDNFEIWVYLVIKSWVSLHISVDFYLTLEVVGNPLMFLCEVFLPVKWREQLVSTPSKLKWFIKITYVKTLHSAEKAGSAEAIIGMKVNVHVCLHYSHLLCLHRY